MTEERKSTGSYTITLFENGGIESEYKGEPITFPLLIGILQQEVFKIHSAQVAQEAEQAFESIQAQLEANSISKLNLN